MSIRVVIAVALLMSAVGALAGTDPCKTRICRKDFTYDGRRCNSEPDPITQALSHYSPPQPLCSPGWHVDGQYCVKDLCCLTPACRSDEKYDEGMCKSGPTFFGWRTHRPATCLAGWNLLRASGWCQKNGCKDGVPPPPAVAASEADGVPHTHTRRDDPPPPAVAASRNSPTVIGFSTNTCVDRGGRVTIEGRNFGGAQGTRLVELGGHGINVLLQVIRWSSRAIIVIVPDDARIERGQWYYIGIQDRERHWLSNINKQITICRGLE